MGESRIVFDHVSKKFRRVYASDSLRDVLGNPLARLTGRHSRGPAATREFWALRDVSFEVKPGEAFGIIGPNGSGKSTILKLLSRILAPNRGRVVVRGRVGALIELGAGFSADLTGQENVLLKGIILGMTSEEVRRKYDTIVEFAELRDFMDTPVKWYSSGMQARLGFSVAVAVEPDVLLVDEVLSVGDLKFQRRCWDAMRSFKSRDRAIVLVSHNLQAVAALCDRAALLQNGVITKLGEPDDVIATYLRGHEMPTDGASGPVELESWRLRDSSGHERQSFDCGEHAHLEVAVKFNKPYAEAYLSLFVSTKEGAYAFHTDSGRLSGRLLRVSLGQRVTFSIQLTLNLTSGEYDVGVNVYDRSTRQRVDQRVFATLVIRKEPLSGGLVFMDPRLCDLRVER